MIDWKAAEAERQKAYRAQVRKTFQAFSDQALEFQSARIVGGIDREECDRELARRAAWWSRDPNPAREER